MRKFSLITMAITIGSIGCGAAWAAMTDFTGSGPSATLACFAAKQSAESAASAQGRAVGTFGACTCTRGDPVECSVKAELVTATSGVRMFWTDGRTNEAACAAVKTMAQSSLSSQGRQVASYGPCLCALNRTETSNLRCTIEARYRAG